jgi:hypothetical protein
VSDQIRIDEWKMSGRRDNSFVKGCLANTVRADDQVQNRQNYAG